MGTGYLRDALILIEPVITAMVGPSPMLVGTSNFEQDHLVKLATRPCCPSKLD